MVGIAEAIRRDENAAAVTLTNANARATSRITAGEAQATTYEAQATSYDRQGSLAMVSSFIDAVGKGLSAAGGYYAMTYAPDQTSNYLTHTSWGAPLDGRYPY